MYNILVAVDGSEHSFKALHVACDLAEKYTGRILLAHILAAERTGKEVLALPAAKGFPRTVISQIEAHAAELPEDLLLVVGERILSQAAAKVRGRGIDAADLPIGSGDPADYIVTMHKKHGANTIVMGSRGISEDAHLLFGSVSNRVFAAVDCTCIAVK